MVLSILGNVMFVRILASLFLVSVTAVFNVYAESHQPAAGSGNGIKYNYLELRFVDVDGGDGIEFGGSYRINEQFYAVAGFQDIDIGPGSLEVLEIGGGYIIPNKKIDFAFEVSLLDADFRGSSENGFSLAAGGRSYISPEFEARVFAKHVDVATSDTFIELGGDYFLNANISIGVTLEVASDADTLTFGGRYYF
jgi:hypothetical protein